MFDFDEFYGINKQQLINSMMNNTLIEHMKNAMNS